MNRPGHTSAGAADQVAVVGVTVPVRLVPVVQVPVIRAAEVEESRRFSLDPTGAACSE